MSSEAAAGAAAAAVASAGVQTSVSLPLGTTSGAVAAVAAADQQAKLPQPQPQPPLLLHATVRQVSVAPSAAAAVQTQIPAQTQTVLTVPPRTAVTAHVSSVGYAPDVVQQHQQAYHPSVVGGGTMNNTPSNSSSIRTVSASSAGSSASHGHGNGHGHAYPDVVRPQLLQSQPQLSNQLTQQPATKRRSPLKTLVTVLTRPSTGTKWGLQISLFDGQYLILGGADCSHVRKVTTLGQVTDANVGISGVALANGVGGTAASTAAGTGVFAGGLDMSAPHLQPGDMILSINQRPLTTPPTPAHPHASSSSSYFGGSLELITQYLRTHLTVTIVALRCEEAMMASAEASISTSTALGVQQSAASAYEVMKKRIAEELLLSSATAAAARTASAMLNVPTQVAGTRGMPSIRSLLPRSQLQQTQTKPNYLYYRPGVGLTSNHQRQVTATTGRYYPPYSRPPAPPPPPPKPITTEDIMDATYQEGQAHRYLNPEIEENFDSWLRNRRKTWRQKWPVYQRMKEFSGEFGLNKDGGDQKDKSKESGDDGVTVRSDFWTVQGYPSFDAWLQSRKSSWAQNYSWHKARAEAWRAKRRKIEEALEETDAVGLPSNPMDCSADQFDKWLGVRKMEWRLLTRKRQRQRAEEAEQSAMVGVDTVGGKIKAKKQRSNSSGSNGEASIGSATSAGISSSSRSLKSPDSVIPRPSRLPLAPPPGRSTSTEMRLIDELIEEEERKRLKLAERDPLDIRFIFDSSMGCPDDVIKKIFEFLPLSNHHVFMCISQTTSMQIRQREYLWKTLCPSRWSLPRRPRVPWYKLYLTKIRTEEETTRKQSDDVLLKAAPIIFKADKLQQIQKLIKAAKKKSDFNVNYTSGVVCERNSLLNLAVIDRRHKIAKWLIEECGANIETVDRGNFSPLLNAAYNGDKPMVRYLLIRGANRKLIGKYHSSKGICAPDFPGHNAEGWARERGHTAVADLIRLGL